jgi:4'-phosphopantetheinyl transferase
MNNNKKIRNPKSEIRNLKTLYPVILPVPEEVRSYKPRDRVVFLSEHARKALALCARKSGIALTEYKKDPEGAPLPADGFHWSVTHKTNYVGGVLSTQPVGIDIEKIQPCSAGLFRKTATEDEAVKASTIGIKDLLKCRIHQIVDDHHLEIKYLNKRWQIEHFFFDDHIASIVQNDFTIEWTLG